MKRLPGIQASRGCTEPAAVAFAAAAAARALDAPVEAVRVRCDPNTLKNAQAAGIPGSGGRSGAALAAALGALAGDPDRGLQALSDVPPAALHAAEALVAEGRVQVEQRPSDGAPRLWVEAEVTGGGHRGVARLVDAHSRLVALERDGTPVPGAADPGAPPATDPDWSGWSLDRVLALADVLDAEDRASVLLGLGTNLAACGRPLPQGLDLPERAERIAERASCARMTGRPVTLTTSGFSGNQGLVATIPVGVVAEALGADEATLARALATSHLVGSFVRARTGILSPVCNATQAASAGAAAGCALLLGGSPGQLERAAVRVLATTGGVVCDGAKAACSLKVGLGAALAVRAAQRVLADDALELRDGIAGETLAETAANLGRIAHPGMQRADQELLAIALGKAPRPGPCP
ncbi:MAG: L-serine ammonia-lyase, iron-sulfur-dependent, subunit alpha [Planctomycetota bacterium]